MQIYDEADGENPQTHYDTDDGENGENPQTHYDTHDGEKGEIPQTHYVAEGEIPQTHDVAKGEIPQTQDETNLQQIVQRCNHVFRCKVHNDRVLKICGFQRPRDQ